MANLNAADITPADQVGKMRDVATIIEGEHSYFDKKFQNSKRFAEQIKTGDFLPIKKDVDLNAKLQAAEDAENSVANRFQKEVELL